MSITTQPLVTFGHMFVQFWYPAPELIVALSTESEIVENIQLYEPPVLSTLEARTRLEYEEQGRLLPEQANYDIGQFTMGYVLGCRSSAKLELDRTEYNACAIAIVRVINESATEDKWHVGVYAHIKHVLKSDLLFSILKPNAEPMIIVTCAS